jgi:APA family basic amino acid/polyamine antiporter
MSDNKEKLGLLALISMVIGSQVGCGTFNLPSVLAPYKMTGLIGWSLAIPIAICLAIIFSELSARLPKNGGPHVFILEAFGKTFGFFTAWTYWLISWSSNSIIIVTIVNYLTTIIGPFTTPQVLIIESFILFIVTYINLKSLEFSGTVETILAILKVAPLIILPIIFFTSFDSSSFRFDVNKESNMSSTISTTALLAFWGFIGVECATTPAANVYNPQKTLPRAIIIGTLFAAFIYILNIASIVGVIGFDKLATSPASYAVTMDAVFGGHSDILISIFIITICLGTLNTWTFSSCRMAHGAYTDGLFPKIFGKVNKFQAPVAALILAAIGTLPLLIYEQCSKGGLAALTDMMCSSFLYVYLISCFAYLKLINKWYKTTKERIKPRILAGFAIAGCLFVLSDSFSVSIFVMAIFIALGIPIYFKTRNLSI